MGRLLGFVLTPLSAFVPWVVSAAIVPCDGVQVPCDACMLVQLAQNILNFLVTITASIAVVMFVVAGIMMVTAAGDTGKLSKAKSIFTNVVIGLVLVLAAWLIIDTIMKVFYDGSFGPWNNILCG